MKISILENKNELGKKAALEGAALINNAIRERGEANIIVATGASQFELLEELIKQEVDWSKVTGFHLDEYIGISDSHPTSFRKYLKERFVDRVQLKNFHYVSGEVEPYAECKRLGEIIETNPIDVAFAGIGENGHLAFNDPPADFETEEAYIVVNLDEACRRQQMGEGWFKTLEEVPKKAISMSVKQIMKSKALILSVPDSRKAEAVKRTLEGDISPLAPASIVQSHFNVLVFLDKDSSRLLN